MSAPLIVERAISLTQPWATLMASGAKRIETRSWATKYRGWIAIHAAKGFPSDCRRLCLFEPFASALVGAVVDDAEPIPCGKVVAVAELYDCARTEDIIGALSAAEAALSAEFAFGNYSVGRYGFITRGVRRLREPMPMKGSLGIWRLPRPITEEDLL